MDTQIHVCLDVHTHMHNIVRMCARACVCSFLLCCICDVRGQLPLPAKASQAATFHVVSRKGKMRIKEQSREGSDKERNRSHSRAVQTDRM